MLQNIITIWLDRADKTDSALHLLLCKIDPYVVTFRDTDRCIDYITDLKEDEIKTVLIISSGTASLTPDTLLQLSEELLQIVSIYILSSNDTNIETLELSEKVQGFYTDSKLLCDQLCQLPYLRRKRGEQFLRTDFSITSLSLPADPCSLTTATITTEPLSVSRKRQEAEFMYARFLRDILIEIESSEEEMVKFCRQKCAANQADLKIVEEFELYYDACNAIFWYTRPTFLYRLLNKALREQDIDTLYAFRYFIRDLHLQLKERHGSHQPILAEAATTAYPLTT
ncbi:unnamed protein product, partial [Didymodactylos carnosus]